MITAIVINLFSAANVCIAYNKMYQATTFSIAVLGVSALVPQLYIISIAIRWTGLCNLKFTRLKRQIALKIYKSIGSSEVSALIEGNGENDQSLYDAV